MSQPQQSSKKKTATDQVRDRQLKSTVTQGQGLAPVPPRHFVPAPATPEQKKDVLTVVKARKKQGKMRDVCVEDISGDDQNNNNNRSITAESADEADISIRLAKATIASPAQQRKKKLPKAGQTRDDLDAPEKVVTPSVSKATSMKKKNKIRGAAIDESEDDTKKREVKGRGANGKKKGTNMYVKVESGKQYPATRLLGYQPATAATGEMYLVEWETTWTPVEYITDALLSDYKFDQQFSDVENEIHGVDEELKQLEMKKAILMKKRNDLVIQKINKENEKK